MRKKAQTIIIVNGYDWKAGAGSETVIKSYIPYSVVETFYKLLEEYNDDEDEFNIALKENKEIRKYIKRHEYYSTAQWSVREFMEQHQVGKTKKNYNIDDMEVSERQWDLLTGGGFNHWTDDYLVGCIHACNEFSFGDNI